MDRGAWWVTAHSVSKSRTRLSEHAHTSLQAVFHLLQSLYWMVGGKSKQEKDRGHPWNLLGS